MRLLTLATFGWIGLNSAALAESASLLQNKYEPLVSTRAGQVDVCGIHFSSAVQTLNGRLLSVQGSVNHSYIKGKAPFLSIKVTVSEFIDGKLIPRKTHFASYRASDYNTRSMVSSPSDDGIAFLLVTDMLKSPELYLGFQESFPGAWVSISIDPNKSEYTFRLPPIAEQDLDTLSQLAKCNVELVETLQGDLKGRGR